MRRFLLCWIARIKRLSSIKYNCLIARTYNTWYIKEGFSPEDIPYILKIDLLTQEDSETRPLTSVYPWTEDDLYHLFVVEDTKLLVAYHRGCPVGFLVYTKHDKFYEVEKIAVHPKYQRKGIGTELVWSLAKNLDSIRSYIEVWVRESNLGAIKFFMQGLYRRLGISSVVLSLVSDSYPDTHEDSIVLQSHW